MTPRVGAAALALLALLGVLARAASLGAQTAGAPAGGAPAIPPGQVRAGTLSFDGHATVGDFVGTTHAVKGEHSGGARLADVHGWVEGDVATLATGNGHRDRDLRSSMETDRYPTMRFELARVVPDDPAAVPRAGAELGAMLEGALTLHGVRKAVAVPARLRFAGDTVRVRSDFPVNLKDYGIGGLTKMLGVLRMNEHIAVHADLVFAP
ncbi:MAG TPA: YceI family protein [Gemmatimonadales bacterium]|nr:YceI family protein [Gemmatimonadales bacterium]